MDFAAFPKTMAGVGRLKRICKDAFRAARAVQETYPSEMLGGPGADVPDRGCILERQIFMFAKMILRDRCGTSYDLFRDRLRTLLDGKITKRIGTRPSGLHSTFHVRRKSRTIASFFDVVTFKN